MLTRREFVLTSLAAGVLMHTRFSFAKASQPSTPVKDAAVRKKILVDNPARLYEF